jgi:hypothetical protein
MYNLSGAVQGDHHPALPRPQENPNETVNEYNSGNAAETAAQAERAVDGDRPDNP